MSTEKPFCSEIPASRESSHRDFTDQGHEIDEIRRFNRTPRPYFRDGEQVQQDKAIPAIPVGPNASENLGRNAPATVSRSRTTTVEPLLRRRDSSRRSVAGSESGTEADDERPGFVRVLPPAVIRPRKGLKTGEKNEEVLLTPAQLDDEGRPLADEFWARSANESLRTKSSADDLRIEAEKLQRRRFAEFLRRMSEVSLMGVMITAVMCGHGVAQRAWEARHALLCQLLVIVGLVAGYPVKLSIVDTRAARTKLWERFRVPASFDPATVLYPPLLPVLVALSVSSNNSDAILLNIILGLSSLPQRLFPRSSRLGGLNALHWLISILPLIIFQRYDLGNGGRRHLMNLSSETLVSLYPLHHTLMTPLMYITQTSLLISEAHLCSAALINLLLISETPQIVILKACLWIGGVSLFAICGPVLRWYLALVRVPKWKLRRAGATGQQRSSMIDAVGSLINLQRAAEAFTIVKSNSSDADEDDVTSSLPRISRSSWPLSKHAIVSEVNSATATGPGTYPTASNPFDGETDAKDGVEGDIGSGREPLSSAVRHTSRRHKKKSTVHWSLQLTVEQARLRKRLYVAFFYTTTIILILGPVQYYVWEKALSRQNPILWAIGYMGGQLSLIRNVFDSFGYQNFLVWPPLPNNDWTLIRLSWVTDVERIRMTLGAANVRLLLIVYWGLVLLLGLLSVFSLTAFVEVDTRRKVFHGVMVAMLVPSIFVDPCCCALALILILTVFLLLEVIRAGQVPPLGNAIGRFVAPYVDGRDLRGPVVVSHIFLLIGCAIPLWFSLASIDREGVTPWVGWELVRGQREVAMVAGVICVGMGDAAASLIGRRYGKHKWLWVGGKSLEGSAAFALAVTIGLMTAKTWQVFGGWQDVDFMSVADHAGHRGWIACAFSWSFTLTKAVFCACSASFMEAVLTGANDNVVVPIALWLFVKGCRI